jgi:hypothetical protein
MPSRLERLFDYHAADLHRLAPKYGEHFGCPLCCRVFKRVADLRDIVAEEHVVSRKLGGRIVTLTCRTCNSEHGTELDAHLVQRVHIEANKVPMRARVKMGTAAFGAEMFAPREPGAPIKINGIRKQSDPRQDAELERLAREGQETINLKLKFGFNANRSVVALVRSAYLLMFRTFGYRYVLDASAAVVREQLQNPTQKGPVLNGIMWRVTDPVPPGNTVAIMHTPESTRSFFVILSLDKDTGHVAGVTLPPPGSDGAELYPRLLSPEARGQKALDPLPIPKKGFLPFHQTWRYIVDGDDR